MRARVKVLEAFSYRRPVVANSIGAEGITATHGEEILIADTPEAFASECLRLMDDPLLAARLAANAFSLLQREYSLDALRRRLDAAEPTGAHAGHA